MKYLRSYLLVPGAGGQILRRPFRRLTTDKVTISDSQDVCFTGVRQRRQVSTDGVKNSQLAVVGQVAPALPPPTKDELEYVSVRHVDAKRRLESKAYPVVDQGCPRHGGPKEPPLSYGLLLAGSNSVNADFNSLDPISVEMAFLPTFHAFRNDLSGLFFSDRPKSAGIPFRPSSDASPRSDDATTPDVVELNRSKSLEALLPSDNALDDVGLQVRNVHREIVLPRTSEPRSLSSDSFNTFLEIHNFQRKDSGRPEGEKTEDISPFPKCEDAPDPSAPFIIHNDRTSIIIHRDLYITNRILEKLKQMEENLEITPEPTGKPSSGGDHSAAFMGDQNRRESKSLAIPESASSVSVSAIDANQATISCSAAKIPKDTHHVAITGPINSQSNGHSSFAGSDCVSLPVTVASPDLKNAPTVKSGSRLTNAEFDIPPDRLTRLESLALQSRKNLYARMKNASSPCVLIDGVHVQHHNLEGSLPSVEKEKTSSSVSSLVNPNSEDRNRMVTQDPEHIPDDLRPCPVGVNVAGAKNDMALPGASTALMHSIIDHSETIPDSVTRAPRDVSPPSAIRSVSPAMESLHPGSLVGTIESYALIDSFLHDFSELNQPEMGCNDLDPFHSNDDLKFDQVQNDLEDWFIPLGKEIESMLLTLEASKKTDHPEHSPQDLDESSIAFEEDFLEIRDEGFEPFEGVETIECALLSPRGGKPFEPGQSRDKSTAGNLPPKTQNPNVDIKTETTIKCTRSGKNTDINVTETQRYLDKRLPYPFCTETVLQVCGKSSSLHEASQAVENSKSQLVHLSNASSPNPGMLTPKLQFNHMLSKSHENLKSNNKKTVLKIKVVPNTSSPSIPSEPKPQPSHILQLTEEPSKMSTDVSKLIRRSKFNHKTGPKKACRGDAVMKLRPKKKPSKEPSEKIKVLSPKELEKMFPSPPKPKTVEKPRKVTVETKAGKEHPALIDNLKQKSSQGGFMTTQFKSPKVQDDILKKPDVRKSMAEMKVDQPGMDVPGVSVIKPEVVFKEQTGAGLSARDQKILKSIISHKVKDSFMAVTKKGVNPGEKPKLDTTISQLVNNFPRPETKYEKPKYHNNDPKTVYAKILEKEKEKPVKDKVPLTAPRPKSPRPESPTPKPNREYITVKTEPTQKTAALSKAPVAPTPTRKPGKKSDESVLPVSASTIIANVMKSSPDSSQAESRWHHLDKKTASEPRPERKVSRDRPKCSSPQRQPASSKSYAGQKSQMREAKTEVGKTGGEISIKEKKRDITERESFEDKNVWDPPSEPLFFPFETPNYKEMLHESPSKSRTVDPLPVESSNSKANDASSTYETDFCKLCTENTPGLDHAVASYRVPLDRMKNFPLMNPGKPKSYTVPSSGAMSINPVHDLMLMRNLRRIPAVTKVLGATLSAKSQQALDHWKQGLISTLGEQGFQEFYQNQLKRGSDFHSTVRKFLANRLECKDDLCVQSLNKVLGSVSEVSIVESQVVHPLLGYRGVIDCVAKYKGKPVVIEWKRSDKTKPSLKHTYDAPLQLSAYLGAMNFDSNYKDQQVEGGVVVVAYSDGSPADVFELSVEECERYWAKWLKRLHQFYNSSERMST